MTQPRGIHGSADHAAPLNHVDEIFARPKNPTGTERPDPFDKEAVARAIRTYMTRQAQTPEERRRARIVDDDHMALSLRRALWRISLPLARAAAPLVDRKAWCVFGYARADDYCRERLGRSGRWLRHQKTLGHAVQQMPALGRALQGRDGGRPIGKVAAWSIARVATEETLADWIAFARRSTVRQLNDAIRDAVDAGRASPPSEDGAPAPSPSGQAVVDGASAPSPSGQAAVDDAPGDPRVSSSWDDSMGPQDADEGADDRRRFLRIPMPAEARQTFYDALELHHLVCGRRQTVESFVETLVAEAFAGPCPPQLESRPVQTWATEAEVEMLLAEATAGWAGLAQDDDGSSGPGMFIDELQQLDRLDREAGQGDVVALDRQLRALIGLEDRLESRLGEVLLRMTRRRAWTQLGFLSLAHYAEERLRLSRAAATRRVRLARSLARFPILRAAYHRRRLGLDAALCVVRVLGPAAVDPELETAWVERAAERTLKRLRQEVELLASRASSGGESPPWPLTDEEWTRSRQICQGQLGQRVRDAGSQAARSGKLDVFLRLILPADLARAFSSAIESACRQCAEAGETPGGDPEGRRPSVDAARRLSQDGQAIPAWVGLLALLEDYVETWDDPDGSPRRHGQDVYSRDGWCCTAPGCTSRRNLEDHHVVFRSQGGDVRDPANRTTACRFHHQRGIHGELAAVRGRAPGDLVWRLGRRDVATWFRNERRLCA